MGTQFRPTEVAAFAPATDRAGVWLCQALGVPYHPRAARYYADIIRRRAWRDISAEVQARVRRYSLQEWDRFLTLVLD